MTFGHLELVTQITSGALAAAAAVFGWLAKRHSKAAKVSTVAVEDAVNHRHDYDGQPPRLYDIALENRRRLTENEFANSNLFEAVDRLEAALTDHVAWEQGEKWPEVERIERERDHWRDLYLKKED